jgi:Reverse transcriptase (RNA-dependent DNA polymerase)
LTIFSEVCCSETSSSSTAWKGLGSLFTPSERRRGIPIGNQTSQFFANVYLDPLDHFVKDRLGIKGYIRYSDDFLVFSDDKSYLADVREQIKTFLVRLRLWLHPAKSVVFPVKDGASGTQAIGAKRIRTGCRSRVHLQSKFRKYCSTSHYAADAARPNEFPKDASARPVALGRRCRHQERELANKRAVQARDLGRALLIERGVLVHAREAGLKVLGDDSGLLP